jgi:hypothetical protein
MFVFHLRKEHKLIGIMYNLHIEYSKVEMVTFLYLYLLISLTFVTIAIAWFDSDGEQYDDHNGYCRWGCNHED